MESLQSIAIGKLPGPVEALGWPSEHASDAPSSAFASSAGTHDVRLAQGQHLFRSGDKVDSLYRVKRGVLKSYQLHASGDEEVLDIHYPGDAICLDGTGEARAFYSVLALEGVILSRVPACAVARDDATQRLVIGILQQEIEQMLRSMRFKRGPSEQRLCAFLLQQARHDAPEGQHAATLRLPVSRRDLALYLGLATETLSRVFSRLCASGVLRTDKREVAILDFARLRRLAG